MGISSHYGNQVSPITFLWEIIRCLAIQRSGDKEFWLSPRRLAVNVTGTCGRWKHIPPYKSPKGPLWIYKELHPTR